MPTREESIAALKRAVDAGDTGAANEIAAYLDSTEAAEAPPAPIDKPTYHRGLREQLLGAGEAALTMASGAAAEPVAGVAGIAASLNPFGAQGSGARTVESVREGMTYQPRTEAGRESLQTVAETVQPVTDVLQAAEEGAGEFGYKYGGPVGGAIGRAAPTAIAELMTMGAGKAAGGARRLAKAVPDDDAAKVLKAGEQFDIPIMTTDVRPPKGYMGRWTQRMSERLGVFGVGGKRASQQEARQAALSGFAEQFDIDIDSPFAGGVVASVNKQLAGEIKKAADMRNRAVASLDEYGEVPMNKTLAAVERELAKQKKLKAKADNQLVTWLEDTKSSITGNGFADTVAQRSTIIDDLKEAGGMNPQTMRTKSSGSMQTIKSAMDEDMLDFAKANDRTAAVGWTKSNRSFADAYTKAKDTELRRVLMKGEATPEVINTVIRGGKPSELNRLYQSLDDAGRATARKAILQDALIDSKFFDIDAPANPDRFINAFNRPNRQKAIKVFYGGEDLKEIKGLARVLNATREAQRAGFVAETGQMLTVPATGAVLLGSMVYDPTVAISATAAASGLLRAYESTKVRNLLLKVANTKKGSAAEKAAVNAAATAVVATMQGMKEENNNSNKE